MNALGQKLIIKYLTNMKKLLILILYAFAFNLNAQIQNSKEIAIGLVKNQVLKADSSKTNLFISKNIFRGRSEISTYNQEVSVFAPNYDCWVFFY